MCNSYGYWYPTPINWFYMYRRPEDVRYIHGHQYPAAAFYEYYNDYKFSPVISFFTSIGFLMWLYVLILSVFVTESIKR